MIDTKSTIVVTGAAGFIGSNVVKFLNRQGFYDIVIVDDMSDGKKYKNLKSTIFSTYLDIDEFFDWFDAWGADAVIHMGACSSTMEWNGKKMMDLNFTFTSQLIAMCANSNTPLIYASSASVYGNKSPESDPLNMYAFSKYSIDMYFSRFLKEVSEDASEREEKLENLIPSIVGLRFFNVYGPGEQSKDLNQTSPIHKFYYEYKKTGKIDVFNIDSKRDFVYVEDVCEVIYFFLNSPSFGIFDVGTGDSRTFDDVANIISGYSDSINKIEFPEHLNGHYQFCTKADLQALRNVGYSKEFLRLEDGIKRFKEEIIE